MVYSHQWKLRIGAVSGLVMAALGWVIWKAIARPTTLGVVTLTGVPALAGADEVRTFAVTVDGKAGGSYTISTAVAADGTQTIQVTAAVKVRAPLHTYVYELNSIEVWRTGQLVSLTANSNDDGKKRSVTAVANGRDLTVTVNRNTRKTASEVLTATGVQVPAADKVRNATLFDAEDGSETAVRVEPLGACRVMLNGQVIDGTRFKLTGKDVDAEWWFDKAGRVLRQEMKWDGHKVVLELTGVK